MPVSRQPTQVPQAVGRQESGRSFQAANPFRRQDSGSLREEAEGEGQRRCAEALSSAPSAAPPQPPRVAGATQPRGAGPTRPQEAGSERESFWATTAAQKAAFAAAFGRAQEGAAGEARTAAEPGGSTSSDASEGVSEAGYVSRAEVG